MVQVKAMIGRPMPVEKVRIGTSAVPIPFDGLPEPRNGVANFFLSSSVVAEVLACDQQALHQKGCFDQVAAIVVGTEIRIDFAGAAIEEVRPHAMEAVGLGQEADDLEQTLSALFTRDKATIDSNGQRHHTEPGGAD